MKTQRTAVTMKAVPAPATRVPRPPISPARVKELAIMGALVVGVTSGGVALGVYGVSPLVRTLSWQRISGTGRDVVARAIEIASNVAQQPDVMIALALTAIAAVAAYVGTGWWKKRSASRTTAVAATAMSFSPRTPRDVQVLAAAGRKPAEIAARTRLPVDAVSMLLNLGQAQ